MTVEDLEVNREVRATFARNWVNLQRLEYAAVHGTIYVRGRMMLLREPEPDSTEDRDRAGVGPRLLFHLERELLKIKGVRGVTWALDGWQRTSMNWSYRGH